MGNEILIWDEYKETIPPKNKNIFKQNMIFYIEVGHFIAYLILFLISLGIIVGCLFIESDIARNCLICLGTGLFASVQISTILEIINNKKLVNHSTKHFNRFLFQIYITTYDLINTANIKETLIQRETLNRYTRKYGASASCEKDKMDLIRKEVQNDYDSGNMENITTAKIGLGTIMFEVSKSVTLSVSAVLYFMNKYMMPSVKHYDEIEKFEKKLQAWDRALQSFIYRYADPNITFFQNIVESAKQFLKSDFVKDNYIV